jgi:hypothetical protein
VSRLAFGGFEGQHELVDGFINGALSSIDTSVKRSGAASGKIAQNSTNKISVDFPGGGVSGRTYRARCWFRIDAFPSATRTIMAFRTSAASTTARPPVVKMDSSGRIIGADGTLSAAVALNTWFCVELSAVGDGTNNVWSVRLAESLVGASATTATTTIPGGLWIGNVDANASFPNMWMDDWALNDDQGSAQNSWPGAREVILASLPTADSAVGSDWKLGAGTTPTGNAHGSVDNVPPVGVANASGTDGAQIKDSSSTITNPTADADFTMQDYLTAGAPAGATITATRATAVIGQGSSTSVTLGTKIVSNPADGSEGTANNGTTAAGTFPTGWKPALGPASSNPTVTLGTSPVARVGKRSNSAQVALACQVLVHFGYEPPTYTDSGTGSLALSASATEEHDYVDGATGPLGLSASATEARVYVDAMTASLALAASATDLYGQGDVMSAQLALAASSTEEHVYVDAMTATLGLAGSALETLLFADTGTATLSLAAAASELRAYDDVAAATLILAAAGVDDYTPGDAPIIVVLPPAPGTLRWEIATLHYPEGDTTPAWPTTVLAELVDVADGLVTIPKNDQRTAQVSLSVYDPVIGEVLARWKAFLEAMSFPTDRVRLEAYAMQLRASYLGNPVFSGPITLPEWRGADAKVTLHAVDHSLRLQSHFLVAGDLAGQITVSHGYGDLELSPDGYRALRDAALNLPFQTARGVPNLGIADGVDHGSFPAPLTVRVSRGDNIWTTWRDTISSTEFSPDFELEPVFDVPGAYALLNTFASQGTDRTSEIVFHYGFGADNLADFVWTPGGKIITHVHSVDQNKRNRIDRADLDSSRLRGIYVDWHEAPFAAKTHDDLDALEQYAEEQVQKYGVPPDYVTITLPPDSEMNPARRLIRPLQDFGIGDRIRAVAKRGYMNEQVDGEVREIRLRQTDPTGTITPEVDLLPVVAGDTIEEDGGS